MRVALQSDQLGFAAPGGIATYVRALGAALAGRDDVDLRTFHARLEDWREEPWMRGRPIVEVPRAVRSLYPLWDAIGRPRLPAAVELADVVHITNPAGVPGARRAPNKALVVTVHDLAFLRYPKAFPPAWRALYRLGLRAAVRRADVIVVPSEATAAELREATRVAADRVAVTPLAAAPPSSAATTDAAPRDERLAGVSFPERYVLSVGTIEPRKNLVRLIRGYRRAVADGGFPHALVLAGPSGWRSDEVLRELRPGEPGRIVLVGALGAADLEAAYAGADVVAYPSLHEGFGLPVLEAMARGVPVVASSTSSIPEVAGEAALLVDPRSAELIGDAIAQVLRDGELATRLAAAGRARAAMFTWEKTAAATVDAYRRALV